MSNTGRNPQDVVEQVKNMSTKEAKEIYVDGCGLKVDSLKKYIKETYGDISHRLYNYPKTNNSCGEVIKHIIIEKAMQWFDEPAQTSNVVVGC